MAETHTRPYPRFQRMKAGRQAQRSRGVLHAADRSTGIRDVQLELFDHECHQGIPTVEAQIAGQSAQVVEKPFARQKLTDAPVARIHQVQQGVKQEGQEIEGGQQGGEVLFAVTEVMVQMVTLGFERIVVFVLCPFQRARPSRTTSATFASVIG